MRRSVVRSVVAGLMGAVCSWTGAEAGSQGDVTDTIFRSNDVPLVDQVSADPQFTLTPVACCEDSCRPGLSLFVGTEVVFLRPFQNGGGAEIASDSTYATGNEADDFYAAPRIWVGAGIGDSPFFVQLQYWELNGSESRVYGNPFPAAEGFNFGNLRMNNFDFEGGAFLCFDECTEGKFTLGGRHTTFNEASGVAGGEFQGVAPYTSASSSSYSSFEGTGVTTSLQMTRRIGCSDWRLFAGGRFSWLWGDEFNGAVTSASAVDGSTNASAVHGAFGGGDANMYILEAQLGTQWQRRLTCINADAFFRIALEYQYWNTDSGGSSESLSYATLAPGGPSAIAYASSRGLETNLFGVAVGTGITW